MVRLATERAGQLVTTGAAGGAVDEEGDEVFRQLLVTSLNKRLDLTGGGVEEGGLVLLRLRFKEGEEVEVEEEEVAKVLLWLDCCCCC